MSTLLGFLGLLAGLTAYGLAAVTRGVDSREGMSRCALTGPQPPRPTAWW